ncbi:hypothetical protein FRC02_000544 [Tulasnella sp. 418]|nr:hypothetical protein FRC02_000544 [Tulasnella sp. 418]
MLRTISDRSFQSRTGCIINDEDFRILKFGDIHKLPPELRLQGSWSRSMIGRVDGQVCLVKVYDVTVKGDPERFARDLEFGRKTKVAFIPQVFGYTVGSRERYIVHSLDVSNAVNFVPMMDYIQRKYKSDTSFRVKDVLAMPADIVNALNYLVDRRIITSEEDMKSMLQLPELVIGPNDKILIGTGGIPQRFTIPEAADGEQQGWGDITSEYASPYSHKTAPLVKPPHWVVGVVFHEIYEDFCKTYRDKPEMEIVKYAHDILHDNCEGVLKSDWRAAGNLRSIREYRQITCPNIPDPYLCLYLPPKGTSLPSPGDVAVWVKEDGRRELMTPDFSCEINVHEQITITDDGNSPDRFRGPLFQGEWENKITDELPGGVVRFTFVRPSIIKLWDSRGGHRSLIGYQAAHTFLRKNARSMAQKLQCLPQDIMIVTLAQENYIRAEFVPVAGPQDPESERYYFYIHYEETDTPRRAYWSLSDSPCASGVPDDIPGCTLIRWPLYNYVQLTDGDIL